MSKLIWINSSPPPGCWRAPAQLQLPPPAAHTAPISLVWLILPCMAGKVQDKIFDSPAFTLRTFCVSLVTVSGLQAVCMTNVSQRIPHLGSCCNRIVMSHLAQSSAKLASGTERERNNKLPGPMDK